MKKQYKYRVPNLTTTSIILDEDLNIQEVQNPLMSITSLMWGIDYAGKNILQLQDYVVPGCEDNWEMVLDNTIQTLATKQRHYFEYRCPESYDGRHFCGLGSTLYDADEQLIYLKVRSVPEQELRAVRTKYVYETLDSWLDKIDCGVIVEHGKDRQQLQTYVNHRTRQMFHCPDGDLTKSDVWDVKKSWNLNNRLLDGYSEKGRYELRSKNADGSILNVYQVNKEFFKGIDGELNIITTITDITEDKKKIELMTMLHEKLETADRLKSAFLANMTHEIRTPLNAIQGYSDVIASMDFSMEERKEMCGFIRDNVDTLLNLVNNVMDLSSIDAGIGDFNLEWFNLNSMFQEIYFGFNMHKARISPGVEFIYDENPELKNVEIYSDRNRMKQVVRHFCSNGLGNTVMGSVKMGFEIVDKGIRIYVDDTGIGIAPENHEIIFNRFEKLGSYTPGTGIGLAICKAIVEAFGGKIGVESEVGQGSHFWAWFPCGVKNEK